MSKASLKLFARSKSWPRKRLLRTHQTASFFNAPTKTYTPRHAGVLTTAAQRLKSLGENFGSGDENVETFLGRLLLGRGACVSKSSGVVSTSVGYYGGKLTIQPMKRYLLDGQGTPRLAR